MKLVSKTILYYLLISIPLLLVAGIYSYVLIQGELRDGIEEILMTETLSAKKLINSFKEPKDVYLNYDSLSYIKVTELHKTESLFYDTAIYNTYEKELTGYRVLNTYYTKGNSTYLIHISKTTLEEDELMEGLFSSFGLIIGFLVFAFFIVNWLLSKTLWKPFYKTLNELNLYDINRHGTYHFNKTSTTEFNSLNAALNEMTGKIHSDFIRQKEFTENASHEMQTPLAVIKANIALLFQSPNIKEEEMQHLQSIENTVKKLTALNKALILLSKIENNQFSKNSEINLKEKVEAAVSNFNEMILIKNIMVVTELNNDLPVFIHPALADILLTNLLQNAIRHNYNDGLIKIYISGNSLTISNTGKTLSIPQEELFTRFKKDDASKDSLGLGLSIVKSITTLYNIDINYTYISAMHTFTLKF